MGRLNWVLLTVNICVLGIVLLLLDAQGASLITKGDWEYKDLIAILLTVVTVILAFVALIVGGAAIWGYQSIRGLAEQKAEEASVASLQEYLTSSTFRVSIDSAIRDRLTGEARSAVQDALAPLVVMAEDHPEYQEPGNGDGSVEPGEKPAANTTAKTDQPWQD